MKASANTKRLVHEWRKSNHTVRSYCQKWDPIPQKSITAVEQRCLSMTGRNFLFHHCTLIKNVVLDTPAYTPCTIVTSHLVPFLYWMTRGFLTNLFIPKPAYGRGGIFVNFMIPSMLGTITITSPFRHWFQHVIRQNICLFISFPSIYSIIMFEAIWGHQIKVNVYLKKKKIFRDIFSETAFKIKVCEKYKISDILLILLIDIFKNTLILWINAFEWIW